MHSKLSKNSFTCTNSCCIFQPVHGSWALQSRLKSSFSIFFAFFCKILIQKIRKIHAKLTIFGLTLKRWSIQKANLAYLTRKLFYTIKHVLHKRLFLPHQVSRCFSVFGLITSLAIFHKSYSFLAPATLLLMMSTFSFLIWLVTLFQRILYFCCRNVTVTYIEFKVVI